MSTFIVECTCSTWLRANFQALEDADSRALCERLFAESLDGHPLISNKSIWRNFPKLWNDRWSYRNIVLVGDALHSAHYSIGSGTRLALEDVIALVKTLESCPGDLGRAFLDYERGRKPFVEKIVGAATASATWYSAFELHMQLSPIDFSYSYITRSGRVSDERLRQSAPKFMSRYEKLGALKR